MIVEEVLISRLIYIIIHPVSGAMDILIDKKINPVLKFIKAIKVTT